MDNKLSELSKPVATVDVQRGRMDGNTFAVAWSSAGHALPDGPHFIYAQEYVSALLAELEAKDKRIAELEYELACVMEDNENCGKTIARKDAAIDTFVKESDEAQKRIAELERANQSQDDHINQQQDRIDSLEKKNGDVGRSLGAAEKRLATPVRLPRRAPENLASVLDGYEKWLIATTFRDTWNACLDEVSRISSGFTVEGDE
ncbi:hypothetical protein I5N05_07510 [Serratia marcescens]|nr:hypothetical protein [Serratia marcescens]